MKILQVIHAYYPPCSVGGAAIIANTISETLATINHDVNVYTTNELYSGVLFQAKKKTYNLNGVNVSYFHITLYKPSFYLIFSKDLFLKLKNTIHEYDVIHLHEYRNIVSLMVCFFASIYRIPVIIQTHGQLPHFFGMQRSKWLFDFIIGNHLLKKASQVIALSKVEAEQYKKMCVPTDKISIVPNGVNINEYTELPSTGLFKKKNGVDKHTKVVLYLGRIHKIKGIDILIKAFRKVCETIDDVILVIVGPDDNYLPAVQHLIKSLEIENKVLIPGPKYSVDKLEAFIDASVYVLPSRHEAFPMSVLEACSCGTPVIASRVGALDEMIIDGETGILFDAGDVDQLCKNIIYLLKEREIARQMGLNGKNYVANKFSIEKIVEKLESLYFDVTQRTLF